MPSAKRHSIAPIGGGFLAVDVKSISGRFQAADVPKPLARFMAASQVPITAEAFGSNASVAAWKQKPSYAVVAKNDRMINPDLERFMYNRSRAETIELPGSHAVFISHPAEVAALIERAAKAAKD